MSRSIIAGAAIMAAAALAPAMPAQAQSNAIIVSAPTVRNEGRPVDGVQQRQLLRTNVSVYTGDLNLRTSYGRAVLDARIRLAADTACDRLDEIDPPFGYGGWDFDKGDCRHLAVKNAQFQRAVAIRANG